MHRFELAIGYASVLLEQEFIRIDYIQQLLLSQSLW
jgi:hypothetical protein